MPFLPPTPHNYDSRKCLLIAKHALGVGLGWNHPTWGPPCSRLAAGTGGRRASCWQPLAGVSLLRPETGLQSPHGQRDPVSPVLRRNLLCSRAPVRWTQSGALRLLHPPTKPGVALSLGYLGAFFFPLSIKRKRKRSFIEARVLVLFKAYPLCHVLKWGDV